MNNHVFYRMFRYGYTEAAAAWFANQMESLQKLAYGIEQFFKDQKNIKYAIEQGYTALLPEK